MDDKALVQSCIPLLVDWCRAVLRPLPWRADPTPYHVWVSEIMLQQTRIEAVIPYYARFLDALPNIEALAAVDEDALLKLWEGLGYYSRARNLKKAALRLMSDYGGELPADFSSLRSLPGIGDYTAGSIASIAFGLPEPAVDGNVLRVMTRLTSCSDDIGQSAVRRRFRELLRSVYPSGREAGLVTEGLMELGETVCLPNGPPRCLLCPLSALCMAHRDGRELDYPVKAEKKPRRTEARTVLLLCCGGRVFIRRRPSRGLLAGLWEFPNLESRLSGEELLSLAGRIGLTVSELRPLGEARHIFTHVEWQMTNWLLELEHVPEGFGAMAAAPDSLLSAEGETRWVTPEELRSDYSVPTAFQAAKTQLERIL